MTDYGKRWVEHPGRMEDTRSPK